MCGDTCAMISGSFWYRLGHKTIIKSHKASTSYCLTWRAEIPNNEDAKVPIPSNDCERFPKAGAGCVILLSIDDRS